jgi:hypothetical protein
MAVRKAIPAGNGHLKGNKGRAPKATSKAKGLKGYGSGSSGKGK